jgi:stage V sporulation protein B
MLIYRVLSQQGLSLTPTHAVWSLVISEFAGLLVNLTAYVAYRDADTPSSDTFKSRMSVKSVPSLLAPLLSMAFPLTLNHVLMTLSHSVENLLLPQKLMDFGYSSDEALSHFGILTGMAMSVIFFPSVITNSLSVLLLPRISEAKAQKNLSLVADTIKGALCCGLALGSLCTFVFLFSSNWIGSYIFDNRLAGYYVQILSILCPFMYTAALLGSIINGLGYAKLTLFANLAGCAVRLIAIWLLVPIHGIYAYIFSMIGASVLTVGILLGPIGHLMVSRS